MEYGALVLAFAIAMLEAFKPDRDSRWLRLLLSGLLFAFFLVNVVMTQQDREDERSLKQSGVLESPTTLEGLFIDIANPKLQMGESETVLVWKGTPSEPMIRVGRDNRIGIRIQDGSLLVSATLRDQSGDMIAEIVDNEWRVNAPRVFDRNYSKSALEVKSASGLVVLQVRLLRDVVQIRARLVGSNRETVAIGGEKGEPGFFSIRPEKYADLSPEIRPIFKYPSDLNLGVLLDPGE